MFVWYEVFERLHIQTFMEKGSMRVPSWTTVLMTGENRAYEIVINLRYWLWTLSKRAAYLIHTWIIVDHYCTHMANNFSFFCDANSDNKVTFGDNVNSSHNSNGYVLSIYSSTMNSFTQTWYECRCPDMETLSQLLAICEGNSSEVVVRGFDLISNVSIKKLWFKKKLCACYIIFYIDEMYVENMLYKCMHK